MRDDEVRAHVLGKLPPNKFSDERDLQAYLQQQPPEQRAEKLEQQCGIQLGTAARYVQLFCTEGHLKAPPQLGEQGDWLSRFEAKLQLAGVSSIIPRARARLLTDMFAQMQQACAPSVSAEDARDVYDCALVHLGTATRLATAQQYALNVNGPWYQDHPWLLSAIDQVTGGVRIVKILPQHEQYYACAAKAELRAIEELRLDCLPDGINIVACARMDVEVPTAAAPSLQVGAGLRLAYSMPCYAGSVAQTAQKPKHALLRGGLQLRNALKYAHENGIIHCDVKAGNVLVNGDGHFFLTDWGSSVKRGERILSSTEGFHPTKLRGQNAHPRHDWGLLLVMLSIELDKAKGLAALLAGGGVRAVSAELVMQRCRDVDEDDPLRAFLENLIRAAEW